ncbi:MAG: DUF881 domain-containing protein [Bacillota bacterium]|jgi:uncharacterized protein YlxW (UPF0749 family)|nr:DUF881 domain-containing protein [Bacillota bacterium]NLM08839.1 DUF881 domain-containing protein [Clostridiales Family XIII bacterium]
MKNKSGIPIIFALALVIGLIISIQLNTSDAHDQGGLIPIPIAQVDALEQQLKEVRREKEAILAEYLELEQRLKEIEEKNLSDDAFIQSAMKELERYRMAAGVLDVKGPGVIITVDDPIPTEENPGDGYSTIMIRYDLLLALVNKLKDAGAEAISINGQRIIAKTEISLAGDNVNINTVPTAPPYTIKAIGNPDTLEGALTIRYGIVENMRNNYGLQVSIAKQEEIEIPRYNGVLRFLYAKPVENSEEEDAQ